MTVEVADFCEAWLSRGSNCGGSQGLWTGVEVCLACIAASFLLLVDRCCKRGSSACSRPMPPKSACVGFRWGLLEEKVKGEKPRKVQKRCQPSSASKGPHAHISDRWGIRRPNGTGSHRGESQSVVNSGDATPKHPQRKASGAVKLDRVRGESCIVGLVAETELQHTVRHKGTVLEARCGRCRLTERVPVVVNCLT